MLVCAGALTNEGVDADGTTGAGTAGRAGDAANRPFCNWARYVEAAAGLLPNPSYMAPSWPSVALAAEPDRGDCLKVSISFAVRWRMRFGPGEAFQFDWSEDWAVIGRVRTKLQVAQFKLSHSRAFVLLAYP